jgi:hypothetical protein
MLRQAVLHGSPGLLPLSLSFRRGKLYVALDEAPIEIKGFNKIKEKDQWPIPRKSMPFLTVKSVTYHK